jgi:hypothetical protein
VVTLVAASSTFAVSLAVLVGLVYLIVLRLVDLNEKEPAWALGLALGVGALASVLLPVVVDSSTLALELFTGALAEGITLFLALAVVLAAFEGIGRLRGWSEVNGLLDGVVYGAAVGLGFAAGSALVSSLRSLGYEEVLGVSRFDALWTTILVGLFMGLVGAIIGAGFGWAIESNSAPKYVAFPIAGLVVAVVFGWLYRAIFDSDDGGTSAQVRLWIGLLIPVVILAGVMVAALTREKRSIEAGLADETDLVTAEDMQLLANPVARRTRYAELFFSGDLDRWAAERALHNRQVQLALVKRRISHLDGDRRRAAELEAARLRIVIAELHEILDTRTPRPVEGVAS